MRCSTILSLAALVVWGSGCGSGDRAAGVEWRFGGLVAIAALDRLPEHTMVPVAGYPGSAFHLGAFVRDADWQAFASEAQIDAPPSIAADQALVFTVLDAQTNSLAPATAARHGDRLLLTVAWDGSEPFYASQTPAALVLVDKTGVATVTVSATSSATIGSFAMP
jgi:hypothetical protein